MAHWETLDVEALLSRRNEATMSGGGGGTTSANVGSYAVPLGTPLRRKFPTVASGYTKVEHPYLPRHESEGPTGDLEYEWAKNQLK